MVRNVQATSATGLRKNRVTQKTRLRIVRGQLDADALVLDDEEERNKVLASQGVDAEDANEHHLQAVLNGYRKPATHAVGKQTEAHIPTPDAAGIVEGYEALYAAGKYNQHTTHLRFSETVEETIRDGLAGGFTYFLDERDAEWLEKSNQEARGEGTSASASASSGANGASDDLPLSSTRSGRRATRGKGKDSEYAHAHVRVAVDEDEFELVMGLFEKLTEDKFPFIHLAMDKFPAFADYEPNFMAPLPPATFANYLVPASVPPPERLVLIAYTVYPHWKARKVEREGNRVVPQLDYDDTHESSYICFRRRDVKPVRRTRASSTAYTDKLARLRSELHMGIDIAKMVLEREGLKVDVKGSAHEVWRTRYKLVQDWRATDNKVPGMGGDESLLFDRERIPKKPKVEGPSRIILGLNRRPSGPQPAVGTPGNDQHSPLMAHLDLSTVNTLSPQGYVAIQTKVHERYQQVQASVDREMASSHARDNKWEDLLDLPYQPTPVSPSEKLFLACPPQTRSSTPFPNFAIDPAATLVDASEPSKMKSPLYPTVYDAKMHPPGFHSDSGSPPRESNLIQEFSTSAPPRTPRSLRLRTGRGGRLHCDRRLHTRHAHSLLDAERARWPRTDAQEPPNQHRVDWDREEKARWAGRDWRPMRTRSFGNPNEHGMARMPGQEYWQHPSVYPEKNVELGKRKRESEECEEERIGFEHCGSGLGLETYAEWEKGPAIESSEWRPEPRSRGTTIAEEESPTWHVDGRTEEEMDHAWRVEDRWRYDADVTREEEDRCLLDDFQPKFLRTMITLLDAADHNTIQTDAKFLVPAVIPEAAPKPTRSSSRLGEQERSRLSTVKDQRVPSLQLQPPPMMASHRPPPPVFQTPPRSSPTPPLPLPQIVSGRMDEQIRKMARQTPSVSPTAAATPQLNRRISQTQAPPATPMPSQPNGVQLKPTPFANGIPGDGGATVRVSSPVRPKSHTPSPQQQQSQQGMPMNGFGPHQGQSHLALHPSHAHGLNPQQYATLRNVFADHGSGTPQQQQQQQQHQGRGKVPMGNVNLQMGPGSLNLKLPQSRPGQLRMNGVQGGDMNMGGQPVPMHNGQPRPNNGSPVPVHARGPTANGHLLPPNNGRASPANPHLLGRVSPMAPATHTNSPHHHSHLVPLHSSPPQPRPTAPLAHQQVVGGAGKGHGY